MRDKQKDLDDLRDSFFLILILNLFFVGSSVVFLYLIIREFIKYFT